MFCYESVREKFFSEEAGEYTAYGIKVSRDIYGKREQIRYIRDVFISEQEATKFVEKCNRLGLSPIHIDDVIEDMIG